MGFRRPEPTARRMSIAVIGSGIAGMSAAWLLSQRHRVTVYEKDDRLGGHTNTVSVQGPAGTLGVDTGFIVYNERNYPNLVALLDHLGVATRPTEMSFGASLDSGRLEYCARGGDGWGKRVAGLLAQPQNLVRPRMWRMVADLLRFYREAPSILGEEDRIDLSLGDYLHAHRYNDDFVHDHLLPIGAAIWSTPSRQMLDFPVAALVRFFANHGLLALEVRPVWRTIVGGSREYARRLTAPYADQALLDTAVRAIYRLPGGVRVEDRQGGVRQFDQVVIATHADQALTMLADADPAERRLLGAFRYERNLAILHTDPKLMPRARRAWGSWSFMSRGRGRDQKVSVTYWMNSLQGLPPGQDYFVSLNPLEPPREGRVLRSFLYEHPVYDRGALEAQRMLWNLQGNRRTWFCGSYFGYGFHEDALQSGLAVAEQLGGVERPWQVPEPNGRIVCHRRVPASKLAEEAA